MKNLVSFNAAEDVFINDIKKLSFGETSIHSDRIELKQFDFSLETFGEECVS